MKVSIWYVAVAALFVTCLITANILAVKLINPIGLLLPAGIIIFPLSYLIGDILTEVYGYRAARIVIWLGFFCNLLAVTAFYIGGSIPSASVWHDQKAYNSILGSTPHALFASFISYIVGEFSNAFILAKLKIATKGRWLWMRTISSTIVGEGFDSAIFISIVFWNILPPALILTAILTQWAAKVLYEVAATPLTYAIVTFLKRQESIDTYDYHTNFNPFGVR